MSLKYLWPLVVFVISCQTSTNKTEKVIASFNPAIEGKTNRRPAGKPLLRVIALTDFHGALEPETYKLPNGETFEKGGVKVLGSYIDILKSQENIPTIIVDAGDIFQGSMLSNYFEGEPVARFYKKVGVDAIAVGNHDFDYGPVGPMSVPNKGQGDPRGALKKRMIEMAPIKFFAGNIQDQKTARLADWSPAQLYSSFMFDKSGVKVGVVGVAGESTPDTTDKRNLVGLNILDTVDVIQAEAERLRLEGADYIIALAHTGSGCPDNSIEKVDSLEGCGAGGILKIAGQLSPGLVDVFVGGHTHKGMFKHRNGTYFIQPFSKGSHLGVVTLGSELQHTTDGLLPVCSHSKWVGTSLECAKPTDNFAVTEIAGQKIDLNPTRDDFLDHYKTETDPKAQEKVGAAATKEFKKDFKSENELGNMLTDLFNAQYPTYDLVLFNNGTLRTPLPKKELVYNDIFELFPFETYLAEKTVDGATLLKMIRVGVSKIDGGLSWSSGLTFKSNGCDVTAKVKGKEVKDDSSQKFKILLTDFLSTGGVGFDKVGFTSNEEGILYDRPNLRDSTVLVLRSQKQLLKDYVFKKRQTVSGVCNL